VYYRTLLQKEYLESGLIGYQCIDDIGESAQKGNGCDCIHAFTDQDPLFSRSRYPLRRFGDAVSKFMVKELWRRDLFILPEQTHDWVHESLGLNRYPITRRHYRGAVVWLRVKDTGVGIDPEVLPHIFARFAQVESGSQGGLGIGLSLVRDLVELHGGTLTASSEGPGKGSEFTVALPGRAGPEGADSGVIGRSR